MGKKKGRQSSSVPVTIDSGESVESEPSTDSQQATVKPICLHVAKSVEPNHIRKAINLENFKEPICVTCSKQGNSPSISEEVWFCLRCGARSCSQKHSQEHHEVPHSDSHTIALKVPSFIAWCHSCKADIPDDPYKKLKNCVMSLRDAYRRAQNVVTFENKVEEPSSENVDQNGEVAYFKDSKPVLKPNRRPSPSVRGLTNLGNTCFFNSVLQCLARTPNLIETLEEMSTPTKGVNITLKSGKCIKGELESGNGLGDNLAETLKQLKIGCSPALSPVKLLSLLRKRCPQFEGYDQHDAHELLRHLLDAVRSQDLKRYRKLILEEMGLSCKVNPAEVSEEKTKEVKAIDNEVTEKVTLVPEQVFRGYLVSTLQCQECESKSQCIESFLDLSLPVMSERSMVGATQRHQKTNGVSMGASNFNSKPVAVEGKGGAQISKHQTKKERKMAAKKNRGKRHHGGGGGGGGGGATTTRKEEDQEGDEFLPSVTPLASLESRIEEESLELIEDGGSGIGIEEKGQGVGINQQESGYNSAEKVGGGESGGSSGGVNGCGSRGGGGVEGVGGGESSAPSTRDSPLSVPPLTEEALGGSLPPTPNSTSIPASPPPGLFLCAGVPPITDVPQHLKYRISLELNWREASCCKEEGVGMVKLEAGKELSPSVSSVTRPPFPQSRDFLNGGRLALSPFSPPSSNLEEAGKCTTPVAKKPLASPSSIDGIDIESLSLTPSKQLQLGGTPYRRHIREGAVIAREDSNWRTRFSFSKKLFPDPLDIEITPEISEKESSKKVGVLPAIKEDEYDLSEETNSGSEGKEVMTTVNPSLENITNNVDEPCEEDFSDSGESFNLGLLYKVTEELIDKTVEEELYIEPLFGNVNSQKLKIAPEIIVQEEEEATQDVNSSQAVIAEECSVEGCLKQFTSVEQMTGNNKVGCTECTIRGSPSGEDEKKTVYTKATKQLLIKQVPPVLILHLKRFQLQMYSFRKLSKHVSFPLTLDLAPYCVPEVVQEINKSSLSIPYSLFGVVEHSGTFNGGHYVAYVKIESESESRWYCISDAHINEVTISRVLSSQAYLLFYKQVAS